MKLSKTEKTVASVPPEGEPLVVGGLEVNGGDAPSLQGTGGVPAWERMDGFERGVSLPDIVDGDGHVPGRRGESRPQGRCQRPGDEVGRGRLDADLGEHDGAASFGGVLVFLDHLPHIRHLAGDVEIVGAILGAGLEGVLSVGSIGAHGGDQDEGLLGQSGKFDLIEVADFDVCFISRRFIISTGQSSSRLRGSGPHPVSRVWAAHPGVQLTRLSAIGIQRLASGNNLLQLASRTPGNCPAQVRRQMSGDMFGGELPGVASRPEDHEVVVAAVLPGWHCGVRHVDGFLLQTRTIRTLPEVL